MVISIITIIVIMMIVISGGVNRIPGRVDGMSKTIKDIGRTCNEENYIFL